MKGGIIQDNVVLALGLVYDLHLGTREGNVMVKFDMTMAYD